MHECVITVFANTIVLVTMIHVFAWYQVLETSQNWDSRYMKNEKYEFSSGHRSRTSVFHTFQLYERVRLNCRRSTRCPDSAVHRAWANPIAREGGIDMRFSGIQNPHFSQRFCTRFLDNNNISFIRGRDLVLATKVYNNISYLIYSNQ